MLDYTLEMDRVSESGLIWSEINARNRLNASWTRIFFNFFSIFDDFSKFRSAFRVLQFEKSSQMAKILAKIEENLSTTCFQFQVSTHYYSRPLQKPETRLLKTQSISTRFYRVWNLLLLESILFTVQYGETLME